MIVIRKDHCQKVNDKLIEILEKYNITPEKFKWNKLNTMDKVNALKEFLKPLYQGGQLFVHFYSSVG